MVAAVRDRIDASGMDLNPFDDPSARQHKVGFIRTAKLVFKRFGQHNVTVIAAGIAFYALLALLPTLIAMTSLYSLVADPQEILDQVDKLAATIDPEREPGGTGDLVESFGNAAVAKNDDGSVAEGGYSAGRLTSLIVGILVALFSASGTVQKLMNAVNSAYEAKESRPGMFLRLLAYMFTAGAILFVVVLIALLGVVPALAARADVGGIAEVAVNVGTYLGLALAFPFALTVLYRYSPDRVRRTPWRNRGAIVATVIWVLSAIAFSIYARSVGSFGAAYALLGGIAGLIIFFQLTSISIIIGAEVNAVLEDPENAKAKIKSASELATPAALRTAPVDRLNAAGKRGRNAVPVPAEPISLGKALVGVAALLFLGRNS
ncbi:MAG: YihY/virulence factor BrkB family protein [Acidimicrobiales bacterium]|nr:YihY/virulence factor BrkB family protein [Acidimicrobiales bacterium]